MNRNWKKSLKKAAAVCLACGTALTLAACGEKGASERNLITEEKESEKVVNMFSPMELWLVAVMGIQVKS